jgi:hypothetical protein
MQPGRRGSLAFGYFLTNFEQGGILDGIFTPVNGEFELLFMEPVSQKGSYFWPLSRFNFREHCPSKEDGTRRTSEETIFFTAFLDFLRLIPMRLEAA